MNNKGFMMAEVIVVSAVILVTLMGVYSSYSKILSLYNKRTDYYDVATLYELANLRENKLYPEMVGTYEEVSGDVVYLISKKALKNKNVNTFGIKETFKEYLDYLSTSLDFDNMKIDETIVQNIIILENCSDENDCKYAYLEVLENGTLNSMTIPCTLELTSENKIEADVDFEGDISYKGFNGNYEGENVTSKTINSAGMYVYYILATNGEKGQCSIDIVSAESETICPNYGTPSNGCYYTTSATASGVCTCYSNNNNYTAVKESADGCYSYCRSKYNSDSYYFGNITYSCPYGTLSGQSCIHYQSATTVYGCPDGYSNIVNNTYCW